jgi:hypothetical protein
MKRELLKIAVVLGLLLVCLGLGGCGESRSPFAGTYRSEETFAGNKYVDLDLKEDGKGTWALAGKTVEFTWVVNDGKVWMYLRTGGIVIATPSAAGQKLSLDMTGDWHPGCPPNACVNFKRIKEGG